MSIIQIIKCDVCGVEVTRTKESEKLLGVSMPVVFETEQDEGTPTKPYLTRQKMDICKRCYDDVIDQFTFRATGAMGYNEYHIFERKK